MIYRILIALVMLIVFTVFIIGMAHGFVKLVTMGDRCCDCKFYKNGYCNKFNRGVDDIAPACNVFDKNNQK